jgi:hypothetical protein
MVRLRVLYLTSLRLCVFSSVLEMNLVTYIMVRWPIAGSSLSHPSKQLMADVKHSSSTLMGRRPLVGAGIAISAVSAVSFSGPGGCVVDDMVAQTESSTVDSIECAILPSEHRAES